MSQWHIASQKNWETQLTNQRLEANAYNRFKERENSVAFCSIFAPDWLKRSRAPDWLNESRVPALIG